MGYGALSFISGVLQGKAASNQAEQKATYDYAAAENEYNMAVRAANDPMHPDYWGVKNQQSLIASRLMTEGGGGKHIMGLEGFVDSFVGETGSLPVMGEDGWSTLMEGAASGLTWGEFAGGKDEWVHKQTSVGRALSGALTESGLDLGKNTDGKSISLSSDRYGLGLSQTEFLDEAVDEFAPYVTFLTGKDPDMAFEMFVSEPSRKWDLDRQEEERAKFGLAKSFWSNGFGGAFLEAQKNGAPQAAHQALDRVARTQGILNGRALAQSAPKSTKPVGKKESNAPEARSARDEYLFRDEQLPEGEGSVGDMTRGEHAQQLGMHPALQITPGASQESMDVQFGKVNEVVGQINENPGGVTPPMLQFLELKQQQGFWGHIIGPAIQRFRKVMDEAAAQEQFDALQRDISSGQPKTHMLGGQY